jgi:hypothetical protein
VWTPNVDKTKAKLYSETSVRRTGIDQHDYTSTQNLLRKGVPIEIGSVKDNK